MNSLSSFSAGRMAAGFSKLITALGVWLVLASTVRAQPTVVEQHGRLSVKGNRIVDKNGDPVVLRGMSLFWSQWQGKYYNTNVIKWLRDDWHCTVVRAAMAVGSGGYLVHPEREKEKVKTVVQAAIDQGIYVIIDWHCQPEGPRVVQQSQAFFEEMAKTYGQYPNIIYEIWNEPAKEQNWSTDIKPYHEAVIPKIRAQDPDNLIICGTPNWSQRVDVASLDPLKFTNVAYTLHFYAATHTQVLRDRATAALNNGAALMVTEWGDCEASGNGYLDADETRRWLDFMDKNQISWCNWSASDTRETSAALRNGASTNGGWTTNDISRSGLLVRDELLSKNPAPPAPH